VPATIRSACPEHAISAYNAAAHGFDALRSAPIARPVLDPWEDSANGARERPSVPTRLAATGSISLRSHRRPPEPLHPELASREHPPEFRTPHGVLIWGMSQAKRPQVALNLYPPRQRDELHCHPGSEHIFLVWEGALTIRGIHREEEITLYPGEFVHI